MDKTIYLGIDPGISKNSPGALAFIYPNSDVRMYDMAQHVSEIIDIIRQNSDAGDVEAAIEIASKVISRPASPAELKRNPFKKFTLQPAVELYANYKELLAILACEGIPCLPVSAKAWQKQVVGVRASLPHKERIWEWVKMQCPSAELSGKRGRKLFGRSDALAIAVWLKER